MLGLCGATLITSTTLIASAALFLGSCTTNQEDAPSAVATIRPLALILEPVLGSNVHVLLSPGASPHTYDPRPSDIRAVASAPVLFFGSDDLDGWAAGFDTGEKVAMLDLVPDSLQIGDRAEHPDPHFWMDPLAVKSALPALVDALCSLQAGSCAQYRRGAAAFDEELSVVHDSLSTMLSALAGESVILAHPFLGYFARRYDIRVAGIIEEIPGSEPTPNDLMRLTEAARRSSARVICTLPQHPSRAARAVAEAADLDIIELDPIGGGANGYADLLYFNAEILRNALAQNAPNIGDE